MIININIALRAYYFFKTFLRSAKRLSTYGAQECLKKYAKRKNVFYIFTPSLAPLRGLRSFGVLSFRP